MKTIKKVLIVVLMLLAFIGSTQVYADTGGYTYSHDNKPIMSSPGFSVTSDGIFNVNSASWGNNITAAEFKSPTDLYYYSYGTEEKIYIVDSEVNQLYVFDGNMAYLETVARFEIDPTKFTNAELSTFKTANSEKQSVYLTATRTDSTGASTFFTLLNDIRRIPFAERTDDQRFYVSPLNVNGVYRARRPARDDEGIIIANQYEDLIYMCDTGNNQVLIVDANTYEVVQIVVQPSDNVFSEKTFKPTKLVTDTTGRMYVISEGFYEGIMLMGYNGEFMRFIGVTYLNLTFWETFRRNIATDTQRSKMVDYLNANFRNLTIDSSNFLYTVSYAATDVETGAVKDDDTMIKRINQAGKDVLKRFGYANPKGDLVTIRTGDETDIGSSKFEGITVNSYGNYTVADSRNGRLFTYDSEGNLLYISAGSGSEITNIKNPVAVRYQGENILVLDKGNNTVLRFEPTETAKLINRAVEAQYRGDIETASGYWKNVISENPNYELAYVGVGKTLLAEERYEEAMYYFQKGYSVSYYSKAYKAYRDDQLKTYLPYILYAGVGIVILVIGYNVYKVIRFGSKRKEDVGEL